MHIDAIWLQLHNFLIELWDSEILEIISSQLGKHLKIDKCVVSLSRAKYARICVELDLSLPLKGLWVGDDDHKVFILRFVRNVPLLFHLWSGWAQVWCLQS